MSTTETNESTSNESTEETQEQQTTDEQSAEQQTESTEETTEGEEQSTEESDEGAEDEDGSTDEDDGDDLPDWVREKMSKSNKQAANYRKKLRETEEKLKNAKTPEEVEEIVQRMTTERQEAERALLVENVALAHKLPEALRKRLTGNTREELEADAKELAELIGDKDDYEEGPLEGGLSPRGRDSGPSDPRSLASTYGGRKKRRI